jgi:hypothetical protein
MRLDHCGKPFRATLRLTRREALAVSVRATVCSRRRGGARPRGCAHGARDALGADTLSDTSGSRRPRREGRLTRRVAGRLRGASARSHRLRGGQHRRAVGADNRANVRGRRALVRGRVGRGRRRRTAVPVDRVVSVEPTGGTFEPRGLEAPPAALHAGEGDWRSGCSAPVG